MRRAHIAALLFAAFAIILLLIFAAPFMIESGTLTGLDGRIAIIDHEDLWNGSGAVMGAIYGFGDLICHQMESRTMMLNGNQMPICLRDLGILSGFAAVTLASVFVNDDRIGSKWTWYAALILVAIGLGEWALEYATGFDSSLSRAATGILAGAGLALIVQKFTQRMFDDVFDTNRD